MKKYNPPSKERIESILETLPFGDEMVMRKYIDHLVHELKTIKDEYTIKSQGHDYYVLESIKERPWETTPATDKDDKCPRCGGITMLPDGSECPDCDGKGKILGSEKWVHAKEVRTDRKRVKE